MYVFEEENALFHEFICNEISKRTFDIFNFFSFNKYGDVTILLLAVCFVCTLYIFRMLNVQRIFLRPRNLPTLQFLLSTLFSVKKTTCWIYLWLLI